MRGVGAAPHFSTPGAKATDFSRFGAHLRPARFSRFDPKVPHFSRYFPRVIPAGEFMSPGIGMASEFRHLESRCKRGRAAYAFAVLQQQL